MIAKKGFDMKNILIILLLISCGTKDNNKSDSNNNIDVKHEVVDTQIYSIALDDIGNLPDCNETRKNQLAYIKDEEKFYVCDGGWAEIEIRGQNGDKGDKGDKGDTVIANNNDKLDIFEFDGHRYLRGGYGNLDMYRATCSKDGFNFLDSTTTSMLVSLGILNGFETQAYFFHLPTADQLNVISANSISIYSSSDSCVSCIGPKTGVILCGINDDLEL